MTSHIFKFQAEISFCLPTSSSHHSGFASSRLRSSVQQNTKNALGQYSPWFCWPSLLQLQPLLLSSAGCRAGQPAPSGARESDTHCSYPGTSKCSAHADNPAAATEWLRQPSWIYSHCFTRNNQLITTGVTTAKITIKMQTLVFRSLRYFLNVKH